MAINIVEIIYRLIDKVSTEAKKIKGSIESIDKSADNAGEKLESLQSKQKGWFRSMAVEAVASAAVITAGMIKIGKASVDAAIEYEQQEMSFTSMLGSRLRAKELIADIQKTAASTPFEQSDLIDYSKKLIAVGVASADVIPTMRMLGDVSSALGKEKLPQIVRGYSDIQAAGRAMGTDLRQLRDAAVPIDKYLAMVLKVDTAGQVRKLGEQSRISSEDVKKAFELMTSKGEPFFKFMEVQSRTTGGALSNLRDKLGILAISMGTPLLAPINLLVSGLGYIISYINSLSTTTKTFISISAAVATGLIGLATIFGVLSLAIGGVKIALIALAASTGIGLFIGAMSLLGIAAYKNLDSIKILFYETWLSVYGVFFKIKEAIKDFIGSSGLGLLLGAMVSLVKYIYKHLDDIKDAFSNALSAIRGIISKITALTSLATQKIKIGVDTAEFKNGADAIKAKIKELKKAKKDANKQDIDDNKKALKEKKALEKKEAADEIERLKKLKKKKPVKSDAALEKKEKPDKDPEWLKNDSKEIERKKALNQLTLEEQISHNKKILAEQNLSAETRALINEAIYDLETKQLVRIKEQEDAAATKRTEDKIQKIEENKELGNLTLTDQIAQNQALLEEEGITAEQKNLINQNLANLETQRMAEVNEKKKQQQDLYMNMLAKFGEGQLSLQEIVSQGLVEFYKKEAYAAIDIEAGKMFQTGLALLTSSMFTNPMGYAHLAGAATLVAGSRAAIGSIKLAEGGIVMPQSGGVQATIGEGGRAEAVIPLDDSRSQELLGGNNSSRVIILDADGMTTLAKGVYKKQTEMLRTGELTPRR